MRFYLIGNCYCWALILKLIYGGKIFYIKNESGKWGNNFKHYMLKDKNGRIRHFKRCLNILPNPLSYFLFIGTIISEK